jgi:FkbM family methyltransferase
MDASQAETQTLTPSFKFYGQFDPPVDRFLFERYFQHRDCPGTLIECGAFDGVLESSCKFFEEALNWNVINIEASPTIYAALVENRPRSRNLNFALTNQNGHSEFVDVTIPGYELCSNGSIAHLKQHREWLDSVNSTYSKTIVPARTFKQIVNDLNLDQIDLMVLDIEGHELKAIEGFLGAKLLPEVFCVEHGHLGIERIRAAVEPLGYSYDTSLFVNSYFVRNGR